MSLHRIAALLAKAERTDNVHEAEAYLVKAQALATAASIDLAFARHAQTVPTVEPQSRTFTIGEPRKRSNKHLVALFITIAHNNDAHVDVAHNSTFVICYAMPSDLDVIEAMFTSLALHMSTAAHGWIKGGEWRAHSYVRQYRRRPHTAQTARAAFQTAYVERIAERLAAARSDVHRADPRTTSQAVVLREKEDVVRAFHRRTSQARGTWQGYRGAGRGGAAARAGRSAADGARLSPSAGVGRAQSIAGAGD